MFEVFFYAAAAAVFAFRPTDRTLTGLALIWILVILNMHPYIAGAALAMPGALIPVAQYNLFFALGLICALNIETFSRPSINHLLAVSVGVTAVLPLLPPLPHITTLLAFGLGIAPLMLAATRVQKRPKPLVALGDASYGLFLIHFIAMMAAAPWLAGSVPLWLAWFALFVVGLLAGVPFGLLEHAGHRAVVRLAGRLCTLLERNRLPPGHQPSVLSRSRRAPVPRTGSLEATGAAGAVSVEPS